ncbi:translation termination factor GTPase eRF3 [Rhodotorula kratochvilovae]
MTALISNGLVQTALNLFLALSSPRSALARLFPLLRTPLDLRVATESLARAWSSSLGRPLSDEELALASRLQTLDARLAYIAYGAGPLLQCGWCRPPGSASAAGLLGTDYLLAIAPGVSVAYLAALAGCGLLLSGNGRERWRKWAVMATLAGALYELWERLTWDGARGGIGGNVTMLHSQLHLLRTLFSTLLLVLSFLAPAAPLAPPTPSTSALVGPAVASIAAQSEAVLHRLRALSVQRMAVLHDDDMREKINAFWASASHESDLARADPQVRRIVEQLRAEAGPSETFSAWVEGSSGNPDDTATSDRIFPTMMLDQPPVAEEEASPVHVSVDQRGGLVSALEERALDGEGRITPNMSGFNPNAGSFNPNAGSFQPGGAPPFVPGQQYNPYAQQPQQGQGNPADYYNQYAGAGGYGGYGQPQQQYGGYPQQGYGQAPAGYGAHDPFAARYNAGGAAPGFQAGPPQPQTRAYEPPVRQAAPAASGAPFIRREDPNAPPPTKAPTMSLKIGGGAPKDPDAKPATVSLKIGGSKAPAAGSSAPASKSATPAAGSKTTTPSSSKPGTPAPGAAGKEKPAAEKKAEKTEAVKAQKAEAKKVEEVKKAEADKIAEEVKAVADDETIADLYGVDDVKDVKPHLNIVFIGHVDAGKSTMGGNILYLCGMVDKRTLEKYEREAKEAGRESWYLSWALDSTSQEREKGKTVEVGRAYFETTARRYTILDAPGHKNFVPSMISGAAQADVAVLVISARKGEFETGFEKGGQTREHAMLVKTAGVQKLIVVVNKMDDPTVNWDKTRYDEIVSKLSPFLKGTGYNLKTDVTFIPVSGFTGANIKEPVDRKLAPWVEGPPLLSFLDELPIGDRKNNAPLMMPISEKYADMGCIIVGKIESGKVRKGADVLLMPNKTPVQVAAIYNEMEEEVPLALCGDNIRIRLRGVEDTDINVGFVLTSATEPVHAVTKFEAQLVILDTKNIISAGYGAVAHVHTASEEVTLAALLHYFDKKTGRKSRRPPQFAKKGMKIIALVEAANTICVERFSDHPQLGRFTLRDEGKTVAIGRVTKVITQDSELPDVAKLQIDAA